MPDIGRVTSIGPQSIEEPSTPRDEVPGAGPDPSAVLSRVKAQADEVASAALRWREFANDPRATALAASLEKVALALEKAAGVLEQSLADGGWLRPPEQPRAGRISAGWAAVSPAPAAAPSSADAPSPRASGAYRALSLGSTEVPLPEETPPAAEVPPPQPPPPPTYTVVPGDTLSGIAAAHGVGLHDLIAANPQIANPNLIFPGQAVTIPGAAPAAEPQGAGQVEGPAAPEPEAAPAAERTYTVVPGDSLSAIAGRFGLVMADMIAANPQIANPSRIFPGQVVNVPEPGSGAGPSPYQPTGRVAEPGIGAVSGPTPAAGTTEARVMQWKAQIVDAAQRHGVPPALVAAVIEWESGGNPNALSFDGGHGKGLMQIDDRWHEFARGPSALDPAANIDYGARVLAGDLGAFPGNLRAGVAAYNAGVGGVQTALRRGLDPSAATYTAGYIDGILSSTRRYEGYF